MFESDLDIDLEADFLTNSFQLPQTTNTIINNKKRSNNDNIERSPDDNGNKKSKILNPFKSPEKVYVKRKFPGPAGILTDLGNNLQNNDDCLKQSQDVITCSQINLSCFEEEPWRKMLNDFDTHDETESLPSKYTIKWIQIKAITNELVNQKAPFLAAIIQNVEFINEKSSIVNLTLKDRTGEIQGSIVGNLYETYSKKLIIGAVIVLKEFGVLITGSGTKQYLTITLNNLVAIYSKNSENGQVEKHSVQSFDYENLKKNQNLQTDINQHCNESRLTETDFNSNRNLNSNENQSKSPIQSRNQNEEQNIWRNELLDLDINDFIDDF